MTQYRFIKAKTSPFQLIEFGRHYANNEYELFNWLFYSDDGLDILEKMFEFERTDPYPLGVFANYYIKNKYTKFFDDLKNNHVYNVSNIKHDIYIICSDSDIFDRLFQIGILKHYGDVLQTN